MAKAKTNSKNDAVSPLVPVEEQPYEVPENWCWIRIGNLTTLHRGVSYKKEQSHLKKENGDCLILRGGNICEGSINIETDNVYVPASLVDESQLVQKNDIIIVASTGSTTVIGRAGISDYNYKDIAFGAFLWLVRPNEKINGRFIGRFFQSDLYRNRIRQLASGVNINNIRADYITNTYIPLPPFAEQQRIVDCIENLFAKLDWAKEKAQAVVDGFELRKSAILHKAFTGELTALWRKSNEIHVKNWSKTTLSEVSSSIGDGLHGTPIFDENGDYFFVNGNNFSGYEIEIKPDTKRICRSEYEKYKIDLNDKTVFVSINGTLGKTAFYSSESIVLGKSACYVNVTHNLNKYYLRYYFCSKDFLDYAHEKATGSTIKNLGLKAMRNLPLELPSIPEQHEIVRILDIALTKEQQAKEAAEAVLYQIDTMKKTILARAFRGELGTNNPDEESVAELLKKTLNDN